MIKIQATSLLLMIVHYEMATFNTKRQFLSNITYKHAVQSTRSPKVSENRSMSHNIVDLDQKCHSGASMLNQKIFF
jgi:hypothetical protein